MSILRKINFGYWRIVIEQRADAFHDIETNIRDFLSAQPFQNFAALKSGRQVAQLRDRKSRLCRRRSGGKVDIGGVGKLVFDPVFFFGRNRRRAPNALANISAEVLLQKGDDPPPDPVAQRRQVFVRRVFAKFQPMLANVIVDFVPPDSKQGANDCKIDLFNPAFRNFSDPAETSRSGTTKQVDQKSFDQIVGVVAEKNGGRLQAIGYLSKKFIARFPSRGLDRNFLLCRERSHVRGSHFKIDIIISGQFSDEPRIRVARSATELMIQMADNQFSVAAFVQPVQQRN